jgi:hypothetical protein
MSVNFAEIEKLFSRLTTPHRWRFFDISAENLLNSGVTFGKKAGKLSYECKMLLLFFF